MYGIPPYDESSPWQALPFQYSLHKQQKPQSTCTHTEYIGDGKSDPREALILKLINDLGTKGTILAWHASFEISCLKGLIRNFPQYEKPLQSIIHRMVDLKIPFSKKWIDIPACKGSASIKVVLPVFIPELSYEDLDIQEGMTASFVYSQLQYQDEATQQTQQKQLLEYCKLDTFAMVRIFEKINQSILKN
jgi:D-ribose pyranose/furanose isomerase RbsD